MTIEAQRQRLNRLETAEQSIICAMAGLRENQYGVYDRDLYQLTVKLALKYKKRIAEASAELMFAIQNEETEETA